MANANFSLDEKMDSVETLSRGAMSPEVLAVMSYFGYGEPQVKPIESLVSLARKKMSHYDVEYAEKLKSTDEASNIRADFKARFSQRFSFCKIAFTNDTFVTDALLLNEAVKKTDTGMREQGERFYTTLMANAKWIESLAQFSITAEHLREDIEVLAQLKIAESSQLLESEEAKAAIVDRDATLDQLFDWSSRYKKVAKLALKGDKKLLGMLGL